MSSQVGPTFCLYTVFSWENIAPPIRLDAFNDDEDDDYKVLYCRNFVLETNHAITTHNWFGLYIYQALGPTNIDNYLISSSLLQFIIYLDGVLNNRIVNGPGLIQQCTAISNYASSRNVFSYVVPT